MKRHAIDYNDVMLALIQLVLAFAAAWVIFFIERICSSKEPFTFDVGSGRGEGEGVPQK